MYPGFMQTDERIGTVLDSKYELLQVIGTGGMGKVYRATNLGMSRPVAVKVLHASLVADLQAVKRFQQEARSISRLCHDSIVEIYSVGMENEFYIAMELVDGRPLSSFLTSGPLPTEMFVDVALQCCRALQHAHANGVIHRDLKPSNILIQEQDGKYRVKIVDFGIAKVAPGASAPVQHLTQTGEIFGSPAYMSPEQCRGEAIDARSDIYSLGCVMYECLTGRTPFVGDSIFDLMMKQNSAETPSFGSVLPVLSAELARLEPVVGRALRKMPEQRYQSMTELAHAIEYGDTSLVESGSGTGRKRSWRPFVGAVTAFLLLALVLLLYQEISFQSEKAKFNSIKNAPREEQFDLYCSLGKSKLADNPQLASQSYVAAAVSIKAIDTEQPRPARLARLPRVIDVLSEAADKLTEAKHQDSALSVYRALVDVVHSNTRNFHDDEVCVTEYPSLSDLQVKRVLQAVIMVAPVDFSADKLGVLTLANTASGLVRRFNGKPDKNRAARSMSLLLPEIDSLIAVIESLSPGDPQRNLEQDKLVREILGRLYFAKFKLHAAVGQESNADKFLRRSLDERLRYDYKGFVIERSETLSEAFARKTMAANDLLPLAEKQEQTVYFKFKNRPIGALAERDQLCTLLINHADHLRNKGRYKEADVLLSQAEETAGKSQASILQAECKQRRTDLRKQGLLPLR